VALLAEHAPVTKERAIPSGPSVAAAASQQTLALLAEGLSLEEIAERRQVRLSTVVNVVAALLESGACQWDSGWMSAAKRERIEDACRQHGTAMLRPLKDALGEDVSFEDIRLVIAELQRAG
jgi:ATP-dependent DNA helicase RecQ